MTKSGEGLQKIGFDYCSGERLQEIDFKSFLSYCLNTRQLELSEVLDKLKNLKKSHKLFP
jgi:hypothetical protein